MPASHRSTLSPLNVTPSSPHTTHPLSPALSLSLSFSQSVCLSLSFHTTILSILSHSVSLSSFCQFFFLSLSFHTTILSILSHSVSPFLSLPISLSLSLSVLFF